MSPPANPGGALPRVFTPLAHQGLKSTAPKPASTTDSPTPPGLEECEAPVVLPHQFSWASTVSADWLTRPSPLEVNELSHTMLVELAPASSRTQAEPASKLLLRQSVRSPPSSRRTQSEPAVTSLVWTEPIPSLIRRPLPAAFTVQSVSVSVEVGPIDSAASPALESMVVPPLTCSSAAGPDASVSARRARVAPA